jgi:hypothetical protein
MMITVAPPVVHPSDGHIAFMDGVAATASYYLMNCGNYGIK